MKGHQMQPGSLARFTFAALWTLAAVMPAASAMAQPASITALVGKKSGG